MSEEMATALGEATARIVLLERELAEKDAIISAKEREIAEARAEIQMKSSAVVSTNLDKEEARAERDTYKALVERLVEGLKDLPWRLEDIRDMLLKYEGIDEWSTVAKNLRQATDKAKALLAECEKADCKWSDGKCVKPTMECNQIHSCDECENGASRE